MDIHGEYLNTFEQVEARYNSIKPMISKNHTKEQDIRPLGERRKKHERIKKLSDSCYALMDGYNYGDDVFKTWKFPDGLGIAHTLKEIYALAPITWERVIGSNAEGESVTNEVLKIRNGTGDQAHNTRYKFLENYLPWQVSFSVASGKQFISFWNTKNTRSKAFLPKSDYAGETLWDYWVEAKDWKNSLASRHTREDDEHYIMLVRQEGEQRFSHTGKQFTPPKRRSKVDVEAKAELKPWIDNFWDWACALGTVLPTDDFDYVHRQKQILYAQYVVYTKPYGYGVCDYDWREVRRVLKSVSEGGSESPEGLALLVCFLSETEIKQATSPEDLKTFRTKFNQFINRSCGLVDKWEEPTMQSNNFSSTYNKGK